MVWYGLVPVYRGIAGMIVSKSRKCTGNLTSVSASSKGRIDVFPGFYDTIPDSLLNRRQRKGVRDFIYGENIPFSQFFESFLPDAGKLEYPILRRITGAVLPEFTCVGLMAVAGRLDVRRCHSSDSICFKLVQVFVNKILKPNCISCQIFKHQEAVEI